MSTLRALVAALLATSCAAVILSLPSGVTKDIITKGDGVHFPRVGDTVTMHYTGTLTATGA
eukprot:CAMPEP_0171207578 /NCGR_PEP_ID=MMETSP0790-20130122/27644_1 /TAXON_ID=2925 /ORGANISM="Alexandrium catenella, Strain OF101" /LENGTH=60 /DNA_ID=CAMNT_0011673145 /DNA_START=54 /DNA_END=232 /DNA_ORIENTATION=+